VSDRISRDEMHMRLAETVALRSTCPRAHVGCVIIVDHRIRAYGFNGAPPKMPQCDEIGCDGAEPSTAGSWFPNGCTRIIHAEANAIVRSGADLRGGLCYCTHEPCRECAKLLIGAGVTHVYFRIGYDRNSGTDLLKAAKVKVTHMYNTERDINDE
jgi:dCMP deaminase